MLYGEIETVANFKLHIISAAVSYIINNGFMKQETTVQVIDGCFFGNDLSP